MVQSTCEVTFYPYNRTVVVPHGTTLLEAALYHDIPWEHACGGNCSCTTCHIHIERGGDKLEPPEYNEVEKLAELPVSRHCSRLACQTIVTSDLVVRLPGTL